jgi:glycosyltransferase involved in cell wall biosynthesis
MFPMKFFEYLAAGKPVVAAQVPALLPFARACRLVESLDDFIRAVEQTLTGDVADPDYCLELAREHTWETRTAKMLAILEKTMALKVGAGKAA